MATALTADASVAPPRPALDAKPHPAARAVFAAVLLGAIAFAGFSIFNDTARVGETLALGVFAFLGLALLIALGFEFVNGFHDTANAVATVIYTNSLPAPVAVVWSGAWNFLGVLTSSGTVAYTIVTLLPVELILHVGSAGGYAMIFALLFAAVIWNLGTWYYGIPNSSSHALIGSVLGVGLANQLLARSTGGTAGVDWDQAYGVFRGLFFSPLMGFAGAFLLLAIARATIKVPALYEAPRTDGPPPGPIRALLIATCTAVSYYHGSNDGQKGMGLIMLILIGCAPTAYALNRTMPPRAMPGFVQSASGAAAAFHAHDGGATADAAAARAALTAALNTRHPNSPQTFAAIETLSRDVSTRVAQYGTFAKVPAAATPNLRNDMYLVADTVRMLAKDKAAMAQFSAPEAKAIGAYADNLERGTRYIPRWVQVMVAIALGLGTMIGWKRIVVTVGEKIGKTHLTYGMGAAAELVAAGTIAFADHIAVPVSTTHILSSGVAGASIANGHGLQTRTILNMVLAWVLTLPAAMTIAGLLYWALLTLLRANGAA
jgi:inorganic phosphate transporter, PiT family